MSKWFNRYDRLTKQGNRNCPKCDGKLPRSVFNDFHKKECNTCKSGVRIWSLGPITITLLEDEVPDVIRVLIDYFNTKDLVGGREDLKSILSCFGGLESWENAREDVCPPEKPK